MFIKGLAKINELPLDRSATMYSPGTSSEIAGLNRTRDRRALFDRPLFFTPRHANMVTLVEIQHPAPISDRILPGMDSSLGRMDEVRKVIGGWVGFLSEGCP